MPICHVGLDPPQLAPVEKHDRDHYGITALTHAVKARFVWDLYKTTALLSKHHSKDFINIGNLLSPYSTSTVFNTLCRQTQ